MSPDGTQHRVVDENRIGTSRRRRARDAPGIHQGTQGKSLAIIPFRYRARKRRCAPVWVLALVASALSSALSGTPLLAQTPQPLGLGATGLPVPRFVSLKSDRVQVRQGPGTDHKILWVFNRVGLPVEVIQEHENWRQVRDQEGAVGWVANALLSARRTGVVMAWATGEARTSAAKPVPLFDEESSTSTQVALLEPGVICGIRQCNGHWCHISVGHYRGYIEQSKLWGVYPNETVR